MKRFIVFLVALLLFCHFSWGYIETSVHLTVGVPSTTKLELPDPNQGYIDYSEWACDNSNITMSTSLGVAWITIKKSFEGEATVECLYVVKWYDDRGFTQSATYLRTFYITCKASGGNDSNLTVSISPNGGEINRGTSITLKSNDSKATIYYTWDGSTPTKSSHKYYAGYLVYEGDQTLKAIAFLSDGTMSSVASADFSVKTSNLIYFNSLEGVDLVGTKSGSSNIYLGEGTYFPCINDKYEGNVTIPDKVDSRTIKGASKHAFYACFHLDEVVLPESLTSISGDAFELALMNKLVLKCPTDIYIGSYAFSLADVDDIYSYSSTPGNIADQAFDNTTYKYTKLYVPLGSRTLYRSKTGWKNFTNIVEFDPSELSSILELMDTSENNAAEYYTLQGVKVDNPDKGLYIKVVNGISKKVLLK